MKSIKIFYVANVIDSLNKGWLKATIEEQGEVYIPFSTKVDLLESMNDFEKIYILEGYYKGSTAIIPYMLRHGKSHYSYLNSRMRLRSGPTIRIKGERLFFGQYLFKVMIDRTVLNKKKYSIKFPVRTSKILPKDYLDETKGGSRFAETWFPIQADDDLYPEKYLHLGSISKGCITVEYNPRDRSNLWNVLYLKLMRSRLNDINLGYLAIEK
ncbi:MAG: hypothetical protein EPN88_04925 [Bacteroidetes bacterium]|nr:MAG: hypothetical protein EPN88_04925 [Bacteroidota bacterium]